MDDLTAALSTPQRALLQVIAKPMLTKQVVPTWRYVDTEMRRLGHRGRDVLDSLPIVGSNGPTNPAYSTVWCDRRNLYPQSQVSLTIAAALHLPEYGRTAASFMTFLEACVHRIHEAPNDPVNLTDPKISAAELKSELDLSEDFLARLPQIVQHEPFGIASNYSLPNDSPDWVLTISQAALEYEGADSTLEYVNRVTALVEQADKQVDFTRVYDVNVTSSTTPSHEDGSHAAASEPYVSRRVTEAIEAKRGNTEYDLEKLLQLIHELNQNFAQHHPYACHALLRAVLDHVPPIFGKAHFGAVAANHTWSRTDAKYIKFLAEFKVQADDVLHRPISSSASFIEMDDLPPRARVNALLTEVVKLL